MWNCVVRIGSSQSPDLSVLDLCFNWSLEKKADVLKVGARDLDDLIGAFEKAFEEGDMETPDCAWGCLISCYYEVMKAVEGAITFVPRTMVCEDVNTIYSICLLISEKWTDYKQRFMSTMPN